MKKEVLIRIDVFFAVCAAYLAIPVVIFLAGYLKPEIGIPAALIMTGCALYSCFDFCKGPDRKLSGRSSDYLGMKMPVKFLIALAVISFITVFVSGVGEYIYSMVDHVFRRAIFNDLINYKWPVIYDYSTQFNPRVISVLGKTEGTAALVYYTTFWMPSALFGKFFGIAAGNIFLLIWTTIGVWLTLVGTTLFIKRISWAVPIIFITFSGLDALPNIVHSITQYDGFMAIEHWLPTFAYMSNFTQLSNVFNQCVPIWVVMVMLMLSANVRSVGFIGSLSFAYSPWASIGMIPLAIALAFRKQLQPAKKAGVILQLLNPVGIASCIVMLGVYGPYYMVSTSASDESGFAWKFCSNFGEFILFWLLLMIIEVVPFVFVLWNKGKKEPLFIASVLTLAIIPVYKISYFNDFSMRASLPALFVIAVMFTELLARMFAEDKQRIRKAKKRAKKESVKCFFVLALAVVCAFPCAVDLVLILGSEFTGEPHYENDIGSFGRIAGEEKGSYYSTEAYTESVMLRMADGYENTIFFKYLARSTESRQE
ncbi:MAG: hypothetical protein E7386_06190 [Ruminococcaceae bacterium]|nr:hypothetical protein [Oscillospiraceae bacterium]